MNQKLNILSVALVLMIVTACSKSAPPTGKSVVSQVKVSEVASRKSIAPEKKVAPEVKGSITLNKSEIFDREFFYGADLQYSSVYDKDYDLYNQSLTLGHVPANFRKSGNELQLVADQRRLYPSDVNHPEQVISRYKIISETTDTITVSEGNASLFIVSMLDSKVNQAKDHWARSLEFVQNGNYILQESSVVLPNGDILEVMESVFPKESMAVSKTFEKFKMDPEDAVGAAEGPAARYRLLSGEAIFDGEEKLSYAQHFDINDPITGEAKTIDWYVTPNIKDEHLNVVRDAVEGWNRYFRKFAGIERDVVLFKGRMPEGVKLGDPRFNIINWDSRLVAGAAYESQATDPFTGKQSHSLIYMPVAWFQIGMDYWTNGQYSEGPASQQNVKAFNKNKLVKASCIRDLSGVAQAMNAGRMTKQEAENFSIQLMKQTLFHEVGHALGLGHNFKGSLTFDRKDPSSLFSSSIMDYNDYEIERAAFTDPTSSDGPQLEYDRQALSAIYNQMNDVSSMDKEMPACNDAEADTEESGEVDPLCIRYDIEKDPTESVETALNRVNLEKISGDVTLVEALSNVSTQVLSTEALTKVTSEAEAMALVKKFNASLKGAMNFYFVGGKASISRTVRTNVKSLYIFQEDILPSEYSELAMRERAFKGVQSAISMTALPEVVSKKVEMLSKSLPAEILKSPFGAKLSTEEAENFAAQVSNSTISMSKAFEKDASKGLLRLRAAVLGSLARTETLPFYFGNSLDYETAISALLFESVANGSGMARERLTAASALATFKGRPGADALLAKAKSIAETAVIIASDNDSREFAIALKAALEG
jgi:predicted Zn-dependent protease